MAITLDATVGGSNSNSYVTVPEFKTYLDGRPFSSEVLALTDPEMDILLVGATSRIDHEIFEGLAASLTQRLKWPRSGVENEDGVEYSSSEIPRHFKEAVMELAVVLAGENIQEHSDLAKFEFLKVGPLEIEPNIEATSALPDEVNRLLGPFLRLNVAKRIR